MIYYICPTLLRTRSPAVGYKCLKLGFYKGLLKIMGQSDPTFNLWKKIKAVFVLFYCVYVSFLHFRQFTLH